MREDLLWVPFGPPQMEHGASSGRGGRGWHHISPGGADRQGFQCGWFIRTKSGRP